MYLYINGIPTQNAHSDCSDASALFIVKGDVSCEGREGCRQYQYVRTDGNGRGDRNKLREERREMDEGGGLELWG